MYGSNDLEYFKLRRDLKVNKRSTRTKQADQRAALGPSSDSPTSVETEAWRDSSLSRIVLDKQERCGEGVEPILSEACSQGYPKSAICVQKLDDSLNSAIRITYRISLRSSSVREPRYPLLRVVQRFVCFEFKRF